MDSLKRSSRVCSDIVACSDTVVTLSPAPIKLRIRSAVIPIACSASAAGDSSPLCFVTSLLSRYCFTPCSGEDSSRGRRKFLPAVSHLVDLFRVRPSTTAEDLAPTLHQEAAGNSGEALQSHLICKGFVTS